MIEHSEKTAKPPMMGRRQALRYALAGAGTIAIGSELALSPAAAADACPVASGGRTYVLVHGAWHGGWVWKDVAPALRALGHTVTTPTLTGLGERKQAAETGYNLDTHVQDIVDHIEMENLNDIHLVGWSYGGMVVTGVLAKIGQRVRSVIYLDAFVPEDGQGLIDVAEPAARPSLEAAKSANKLVSPIPLFVFGVKDPVVIAYVQPRLTDQSWQTYFQPVKALKTRLNVPHTYIRCTDFANPSFDAYLEKFKKDPLFTTHVMKTSHLAMLTDSRGTIDLLANAK